MQVTAWLLSASYWMHMLATVAWLGGLAAYQVLYLPGILGRPENGPDAAAVEWVHRRMDSLAWLSLAILIGTGLLQMSANPHYQGFLAFSNSWGVAILLKHVVFLGMLAVNAVQSWQILPAMKRQVLRQMKGLEMEEFDRLQRRSARLMRLNLALGVIVLAFTAMARAAL